MYTQLQSSLADRKSYSKFGFLLDEFASWTTFTELGVHNVYFQSAKRGGAG